MAAVLACLLQWFYGRLSLSGWCNHANGYSFFLLSTASCQVVRRSLRDTNARRSGGRVQRWIPARFYCKTSSQFQQSRQKTRLAAALARR